MEETLEVNFRLDAAGRTLPTIIPKNNTKCDELETQSPLLDYNSKTVQTQFVLLVEDAEHDDDSSTTTHCRDDEELLDELLLDCEIADSGLMPRTFWVPALDDDFEPRFSLERMALDVFRHHVVGTNTTTSREEEACIDRKSSGAEWWVQIRPSPEKTGRYAMFENKRKGEEEEEGNDLSKEGISFHWDKDEDLRLLCGGNTYVHPHLSTVTYLTSIGAPTFAVNYRINNLTGEWISPIENDRADADDHADDGDSNNPEAFVSWPAKGKHLSFDGRFLHAAPPDLMEAGEFARQCMVQGIDNSTNGNTTDPIQQQQKRLEIRRHRRVTFLVNIWLNYHPFDVKPFPETMVEKMSGRDNKCRAKLLFTANTKNDKQHQQQQQSPTRTVSISKDGRVAVVEDSLPSASTQQQQPSSTQRFVWPMGDCDSGESIQASIPLDQICAGARLGENVRIKWSAGVGPDSIQLVSTTTDNTASKESSTKRQQVDNQ